MNGASPCSNSKLLNYESRLHMKETLSREMSNYKNFKSYDKFTNLR